MLIERKTLNDILTETPELRVNGEWLCLNIETNTAWPTGPQAFIFEGHMLRLMPHSKDNYPGIAINRPGNLSRDDAWALLHRALSLIAWIQDGGAMVAHTGALMSRCDAFLRLNCFLDIDAANAAIGRWDAVIAEREQAELSR